MISAVFTFSILACDPGGGKSTDSQSPESDTHQPDSGDGTGDDGAGDDGTGDDGGGDSGGGGGGDSGSTDVELPEPICNEGSRWEAGTTAFVDATSEWGLDALDLQGVWMGAVDFDGDGWTDLAVRSGQGRDDFAAGTRYAWLLRNTGSGFEDVTRASGIRQLRGADDPDAGRPGATWVFGDVDNDGDLDVYTGLADADSPDASESSDVLLGNGDGTFSLAGADSDFRADPNDTPYGAAFVDYDRDGDLDLWVTNYYGAGSYRQDRLYAGDGAGGFVDVTEEAGLTTLDWYYVSDLDAGLAHSVAWAAAACDLNNDGWPELLASSYGRAPNHLWQSDRGAYSNRSVDSAYAYDHRVDWSDNESARCYCTLHPTAQDCEGVPEPEYIVCEDDGDVFRWDHTYDRYAFRLGGNSGATTCADVNNDGWADLMTSEIVHWDVGSSSDPSELLFNVGDEAVYFDRPGNDVTGLTREYDRIDWNDGDITGSVFDFDNDGWKDVYVGSSDYSGTRGLLWHQDAPESFVSVPVDQGIDHMRSHGSVIADFDRDGDLDIVVGHSSARCDSDCYDTFNPRLFENQLQDTTNFVQLRLVGGEGSNAAAIGARVEVDNGDFTQVREVDGGHGQWGNQDDLVLHFGLGEACEATVSVRWPDADGSLQSFPVVSGYRFLVIQGEDPIVDPLGE